MPSRKEARITNIWSKVVENEKSDLFSKVFIESTAPFEYTVSKRGNDLVIEARGAVVNMPEGIVEVNDGLVREVLVEQAAAGLAVLELRLEHPAGFETEAIEGIPFRLAITLDRSYIRKLLEGLKVVVDPGHGGEDTGGRGPVNLLEKNVVMPVARNLSKMFEQVGARAFLTRAGDESVSSESRFGLAKREKADIFVSIHTYSNPDSAVGGAAVLYNPASQESPELARLVLEELVKKLKVGNRGSRVQPELAALGKIPALEVEVVTITNWVEEGLLRSPTVHKKAAEGIFSGIKKYFSLAGRQ